MADTDFLEPILLLLLNLRHKNDTMMITNDTSLNLKMEHLLNCHKSCRGKNKNKNNLKTADTRKKHKYRLANISADHYF